MAVNARCAVRRATKDINGLEVKEFVFRVVRYAAKGRQYLITINQFPGYAGRNVLFVEMSAAWSMFSKMEFAQDAL